MTPNQKAADDLAQILRDAGYPDAKARATQAVNGMKVSDGWQVNVHDEVTEIGLVAVFWGRKHFKCYVEFVGSTSDAVEIGKSFARVIARQVE